MRNNLDHERNPQKHVRQVHTDNQLLTNKTEDIALIVTSFNKLVTNQITTYPSNIHK